MLDYRKDPEFKELSKLLAQAQQKVRELDASIQAVKERVEASDPDRVQVEHLQTATRFTYKGRVIRAKRHGLGGGYFSLYEGKTLLKEHVKGIDRAVIALLKQGAI